MRPVVDAEIGAHCLGACELLVARRGDRDESALRLCEEEREERDAARALRHDDVAGLDALSDDRAPGGKRGARQCRRLERAPSLWRFHHAPLRQHHLLLHHAVERAAQHELAMLFPHRAAHPGLRKSRADEIADAHAADVGADLHHRAGAVGERDERQRAAMAAIAAPHHDEVAKIDRGRRHLDQHLARPGLAVRPRAELDVFEPPIVPHLHHLHGAAPRASFDEVELR